MNKQQFLEQLKLKLSNKMNQEEMNSILDYYDGYIDEAIDFGLNEEEAIENIGNLDQLVDDLLIGLKEEQIDTTSRELIVSDLAKKNLLDVQVKNTKLIIDYQPIEKIAIKVPRQIKDEYFVKQDDQSIVVRQSERLKPFVKERILYITIPLNLNVESYFKTSNASINVEGNHHFQQAFNLIETKNGKVSVKDMELNETKMTTTNSNIELENVEGQQLQVESTNGKIKIKGGSSHKIRVQTSNAKIELADHLFQQARLITTNSKIKVKLLPTPNQLEISYHTSNAKVKIKGEKLGSVGNYAIEGTPPINDLEIYTTNGKIEVE